ncbi:host-nuclease inhibitor Gam family protein [Vagococcus fluvialis]|uniref:host-nuclease inhibitor Gam family protein n=1 Tax=Vagococcus fluvialis TaxID=2738 RepID=UPI00379D4405
MDALNRYEIEELTTTSEEEKQGWAINNLESVNWALRKIAALNKQINENEQLAKEEKYRIEQWEQRENSSHKQSVEFFEQKISEYHSKLLADDPKAKIKTPYGQVSSRKVSAKIDYGDNTINELKELGLDEYVRVKEEVNKADLKKVLTITDDLKVVTEDGEVLSSAIVTPESHKTVIKVEG